MGLFNYVNVRVDCPGCGDGPLGFQTKDGDLMMDTVDPDSLAEFGAICKKCGLWTGFARELAPVLPRRDPYTRGEVEAMGFVMTTADLERQAQEPPETIMGFPVAAFEEIEMASPEDAIKFGSYKASEDFALVRDDGRFVFRKR